MKTARSKLLYKNLMWVVPVSAGSLIIAFWLTSLYMEKVAWQYVPEVNKKTAENAAMKVTAFVDKTQIALESVAGSISNEGAPGIQGYYLKQLILGNRNFRYIYMMDKSGKEICNTNPMGEFRKHDIREHHKAAFGGRSSNSKVFFGEENVPYIETCVPMRKWRLVTGIICGEVDFRTVWNILDGVKTGVTGYASLVTDDGSYLSHPDKARVLKGEKLSGADRTRMGAATGTFITEESRGRESLVAFAAVQGLGWKAVLLQDFDEAFGHYILLKKYAFILTFCLLVCVVAAVVVISMRVARPIEQLTEATKIVAAGDLSHKIEMSGNDEIGTLADSFNTMVSRLNESRDMLIQTEKLSSIGKFAASVVHEIKNPIAGLLGYVYLLKKHPEKIGGFVAEMEEELTDINSTLERLLDLARRREVSFEEISINNIVEKGVKLLEHHFSRFKKIELETVLAENIPPMSGDRLLLQQAVVNLLLNAYESIEERGALQISTRLEGGKILLSVKDNGRGIAAEDRGKIFEPFYSNSPAKGGGAGLGLYITNEIVKLHHGKIAVESAPGLETVFTLVFEVNEKSEV